MKSYLTCSEAADELGVSRSTLLRWFREGRISQAERDHRGWRRFLRQDVERIRRELGQKVQVAEGPEEQQRWQKMRTYLRRVPTFRQLPKPVLDDLARCARFSGLLAGQQLYGPGDRTRGLLILVKGKVRIYRTSLEGREQTLAVEAPYRILDESVLFRSDECHTSHAICLLSSTVLILPLVRVRQLTNQHPQLATAFLKEFARRIEDLEERLEGLALLNLEQRMARTMLGWERDAGSHEFDMPLSLAAWASLEGAARESLSRALVRLEKDGLVCRRGRRLEILDAEGLEAI